MMITGDAAKRAYLTTRMTRRCPKNKRQYVNGIISVERSQYGKDRSFSIYQTTTEKKRTIEEDGETLEQSVREDTNMHRAHFDVNMELNWKLYSCSGRNIDTHSKNVSTTKHGEGKSRSHA